MIGLSKSSYVDRGTGKFLFASQKNR